MRPTGTPMLNGYRSGLWRMKVSMLQYLGALAGDFTGFWQTGHVHVPGHRQSSNPKKNRPEGKLRLMYEARWWPSCAERRVEQLSMKRNSDSRDPAEETPQRTALYVGSKKLVEILLSLEGKRLKLS